MFKRWSAESGIGTAIPLETNMRPVRVHMDDPDAGEHIQKGVSELLASLTPERRRDVVFACIGTDRSTGDALGPLVGTFLCNHGLPQNRVIGTLERPLHAANLVERLNHHGLLNPGPLPNRAVIIAVDACLGASENVGSICFGPGPLKPGAGVNKKLPPVGDIYVTGTVNTGGFMEYFVLQNTRLAIVMRMATVIANALARVVIT